MHRRAASLLHFTPSLWVVACLVWTAAPFGCAPRLRPQAGRSLALWADASGDDATPELSPEAADGPSFEAGAQATATETTSPADRAQAAEAFERGYMAFHRGDYGQAEAALKQALVLYPFLAPAHLTLGKIYMLRGLAAADPKWLQKARRMVEMAVRLDATSHQAQSFLQLMP